MDNYYEILGVGEKATLDEIKKSFRILARKHHPDVSKNSDSEEKFKKINEAYEVLKDDGKRARYDYQRNMGSQHSPFSSMFEGFNFSGFQDRQPTEDLTIRIEVPVDLEELFSGVKKKAKYQRRVVCKNCMGKKSPEPNKKTKCNQCGGSGRMVQKRGIMNIITLCSSCNGIGESFLNPCRKCNASGNDVLYHEVIIDIPPGGFTDNKQRFLKDNGHESVVSPGKFGQLVVDISLKHHDLYELKSNGDIVSSTPVPMWIAVCGGSIKVKTLHGIKDVEIKSGTKEGDKCLISKSGFWKPDRSGYSNHVAILNIEMPKNLTEEDINKIKETSKGSGNYPDYFAILNKN